MVKWKQVLKRPFCITLCSALVITSGNFTVPGMAVKASAEENKNFILNPSSGDIASNGAITGWYQNNEAEVVTGCADNVSFVKETVEKPDVTIPEKGTNILDNPSFNTDTQGWFATGGDLEYYAGDSEDETGGCVKVTNRTDTWNSLAQNIESKVKNNTKYYFSCWVKLSDEYDGETEVKAGLTTQSTGDIGNNGNIGGEAYDNWGISNNIIKASKDEWREIKGSFMANWTGELQKAEFKVADEKSTKSFYVDNLSIKENDADLSIEKDIPSLKDYFVSVNPDYDFRVGTELTADQLYNENKMALVYKHFNSFTAGNEMKPGYIIKGINDDGSLNLDFTIPDTTLDVFWNYNQDKAEKDQIHIRGHVL